VVAAARTGGAGAVLVFGRIGGRAPFPSRIGTPAAVLVSDARADLGGVARARLVAMLAAAGGREPLPPRTVAPAAMLASDARAELGVFAEARLIAKLAVRAASVFAS
jgi:hypothetical protein